MHANPYEAPLADPAETLATESLRVQGKCLVARSGAVLPPFCVKTGVAVQPRDIRQKRLSWCPPVVALLALLSGPLFIIVYFIARKHCSLSVGLSPELQKKYRNRRIFKVIAVVALLFALPVAAAIDSPAVLVTVFILFLIAIVSLFIGNSPLAVTSYRKGEFFVSGCSPQFLARIQG